MLLIFFSFKVTQLKIKISDMNSSQHKLKHNHVIYS